METIQLSKLLQDKVSSTHKIRNLKRSLILTDYTKPIAVIQPYKTDLNFWKDSMSLKENILDIKDLLEKVSVDLEKASNGNRAAAQRVRTATIKIEKLSKIYRKLSVQEEKNKELNKK